MNEFWPHLLLSLCLALPASGLETHWQFHGEGLLQRRSLNQSGFESSSTRMEGFGLVDSAFTASGAEFFFEAKPQVRLVQSPGVKSPGPGVASVGMAPRWLNSRRVIQRAEDRAVYADWDRLNGRWQSRLESGYAEISLGRRPISLGVLRFFPVWNKFTLPLSFTPGPEWIDNPDGAMARYQSQDLSLRAIEIQGQGSAHDAVSLVEAKFSRQNMDAQILVGDWESRETAGLGLAVDHWGATWRLESLHFEPRRSGHGSTTAGTDQVGLGFERALSAEWTVALEYYQQSLCVEKIGGFGVAPLSDVQVLNGCRYVLPYVDYQINSLWHAGIGSLIQLGDRSGMGFFSAIYSMSDDSTLEFKVKQSFGRRGSEFGSARYKDPLGRTMGAQSTAYLLWSTTL
jgi:hypothetical protein